MPVESFFSTYGDCWVLAFVLDELGCETGGYGEDVVIMGLELQITDLHLEWDQG